MDYVAGDQALVTFTQAAFNSQNPRGSVVGGLRAPGWVLCQRVWEWVWWFFCASPEIAEMVEETGLSSSFFLRIILEI